MVERLCIRAWSGLKPAVARVTGRLKRVRPGIWIALVAVFAVFGREAGRLYQRRTDHRAEVADAIGSVGFFYGLPQQEHSGLRLLYLRTSEEGLGLYAREAATGKGRLLQEWQSPGSSSFRGERLMPLSPDDSFLPLVVSIQARPSALAICEAGSGKELFRIAEPGWVVSEGAWLTSEKLVWLRQRRAAAHKPPPFQVHVTERQPDGSWADKSAAVTLTNVVGLAALSGDTIAWADAKGIYTLNLVSNVITPLFSAREKPIVELDYSREHQRFLVACKEKQGRSLWCLALETNGPNDFVRLTADMSVHGAQWVNDGQGYAYLNQHTVVVKADAAAKPVRVNAAAERMVAAPSGDGVFFVGSVGDEPGLGLWRYGASDQSLTNLVCYSDRPSPRARRVEPARCFTQDGAGHRLGYDLYRPVNFNWGKKYPMLIGDTVFGQFAYQRDFDGPSWAEAMANCGAYVVIVERKDWLPKDDQEWSRGVMALYDQLKGDPTVDRGRVFLYGASLEPATCRGWLNRGPGFGKGCCCSIRACCRTFRTSKRGDVPHFLISAGKEEGETERFRKVPSRGLRSGHRGGGGRTSECVSCVNLDTGHAGPDSRDEGLCVRGVRGV